MVAYLIRRLLQASLVLMLVTIIVFLLIRLLPGDPILIYIDKHQIDLNAPERIEELRREYGLDKSLFAQYAGWIKGLLRGDLGKSISKNENVSNLISKRLPITVHLGILAFVISAVLGIIAGSVSAIRSGYFLDTAVTTLANLGVTVPIFWLGILMIHFFGLNLKWLPICGYTSPFEDLLLNSRQMIMPVFCLSVFSMASSARQTRSAMLEVVRQDYIRTAWSKGLKERTIILRHVLKNSLIPVITLKGAHVRDIFGGSVLIETVFNIPGMGRLAVDAIHEHDYAIIQGVILIIAAVVVLANLIVDISYGYLDPRIRHE